MVRRTALQVQTEAEAREQLGAAWGARAWAGGGEGWAGLSFGPRAPGGGEGGRRVLAGSQRKRAVKRAAGGAGFKGCRVLGFYGQREPQAERGARQGRVGTAKTRRRTGQNRLGNSNK
jgi:hypothetical protein